MIKAKSKTSNKPASASRAPVFLFEEKRPSYGKRQKKLAKKRLLHDRVRSRVWHPLALPHHRTCGFPHPAVEPGAQSGFDLFPMLPKVFGRLLNVHSIDSGRAAIGFHRLPCGPDVCLLQHSLKNRFLGFIFSHHLAPPFARMNDTTSKKQSDKSMPMPGTRTPASPPRSIQPKSYSTLHNRALRGFCC